MAAVVVESVEDLRSSAAMVSLLANVPVFKRLQPSQLHDLAACLEECRFSDGTAIVAQGEKGESMYLIRSGGGAVEVAGVGKVLQYGPGASFGEFSLLTTEPRAASVIAVGETKCLRMQSKDVRPMLNHIWGGARELKRREQLLSQVKIFQELSRGELRQLATQMERVEFPQQGSVVVRQGEMGDCMYVVEEGELMVYTRRDGYVAQLEVGDIFGELSVLTGETRQATIRTSQEIGSGEVILLQLQRQNVKDILSEEKRAQALALGKEQYEEINALKSAPEVTEVVRKFWELMVVESTRLGSGACSGLVTREGYIQMHLRTSKALSASFDIASGEDMANADWAEDITAFSGDTTTSVWLEEVKKKMKRAAERTFGREDSAVTTWSLLFERYDTDHSGEIDCKEFIVAVRSSECGVSRAILSDDELRRMFAALDCDGGGTICEQEFLAFVESDPLASDMTVDVFSEAMFQLAQQWVPDLDPSKYAGFLLNLFDTITARGGQMRGLVIAESGMGYSLAPLPEVETLVDEEGELPQEIFRPPTPPPPEPEMDIEAREGAKRVAADGLPYPLCSGSA